MALESGSYIGDLNVANPSGTDPKSQGDDHIRLLKTAARNSFPGFSGVVAGTGTESGSGSAYVVALSPAPASYTAGMMVVFKAVHANAGPATLQVNALAAKALKAVDGSALESGDIESGAVVGAFYDGTDFFLISGADRAARGGDSYTGTHDFTGATAQVATASPGDNSTKAASTAYVDAADALKANLASPALTGEPTAPTAAPGTNTTQVATTAFATQLAFQAVLPVQSGEGGKYLRTDGSAASWEDPVASRSEAEAGVASNRLMTPERTGQAISALTASAALQIFGDGSDGDVTVTGALTLNRDMYYRNLILSGSAALRTAGYRIFVQEELDLTAAPPGALQNDGVAAAFGGGATAGVTVGAGQAQGIAGENGGASGAGGAGADGSNTIGSPGSAGLSTAAYLPRLVSTRLSRSDLDLTLVKGGSGGVSGGGGGNNGSDPGGGGGIGGGGGGVLAVFARSINRGPSTASRAIRVQGGNGGVGGSGGFPGCGGGGGGSAGGGGWVCLVLQQLIGSTATNIIDVSGGNGGNGGASGGGGSNGGRGGASGAGGRFTIEHLVTATITHATGATPVAGAPASGAPGGAGGVAALSLFDL